MLDDKHVIYVKTVPIRIEKRFVSINPNSEYVKNSDIASDEIFRLINLPIDDYFLLYEDVRSIYDYKELLILELSKYYGVNTMDIRYRLDDKISRSMKLIRCILTQLPIPNIRNEVSQENADLWPEMIMEKNNNFNG